MKKALFFAGLAAAALSFVGCNKEADLAPNGKKVGIILNNEDTRTVNNGLSTNWEDNDALNVFYAAAGTTEYSSNTKFTVDDAANNHATGTVELTADAYDWYLLYPYDSHVTTPANTKNGYLTVGSASNRKQTQNGLDSKAHLAGTNLPIYGVAKNVSASDVPEVTMKHVSSVVAVNLNNGTQAPIEVEEVSFTAPEDIVGTYYINFAGETLGFTGSGTNYVSKTATLSVEGDAAIAAGASAKFYLAIKPFQANANDKLVLNIKVGSSYFEKEVTLPSAVEFAAGHIKTLNITYTGGTEIQPSSLADIITMDDEEAVKTQEVLVVGKYARGIMLAQNGTYLLAFDNAGVSANVGDIVTVEGKVGSYAGLKQIASPVIEVISNDNEVVLPDPEVISSLDDYSSDKVELIQYTGKLVVSGTYFNVDVTGSSRKGSIQYPLDTQALSALANKTVTATGFFTGITGSSTKYVNMMSTSVEEPAGNVFDVTPPRIEVPATATSAEIQVTGNVAWTAVASEGATLDKTSGTGEGVITVTFPANEDTENQKEYTVFVRTEATGVNDEFEVDIVQAAADPAGVTTVTIDFSQQNFTNGQEVTSVTENGVTAAFGKGTNNNAPKYYDTGSAVRMYGSNTMTVTAGGKTIKSIEITFGSGDGTNPITTDVSTYEEPTWTGEAGSVTFTIGGTTGQRRINAITVKYSDDVAPVTPVDPTFEVTETLSVEVGKTQKINVTTNSDGAVTYSSANTAVATVASDGTVTGVAAGSTTITVAAAATAAYNAASATVAVTVTEVDNTLHTIVVADYSSTEFTAGVYHFVAEKADASTAPAYNANGEDLRIYAKGTLTVSNSKENMTKIVFNLSSQGLSRLAPITASTGNIAAQAKGDTKVTWTGNASEVVFTVGDKADYGSQSTSNGQLCFTTVDVSPWSDGDVQPKTLSSIEVSGQKTTFTVGDEFSFGGTVTAVYSDGSRTAVDESEVSFTGYDMAVAGEQTVQVTYQTKSVEYVITVNAKPDVVGSPWTLVSALSDLTAGTFAITAKDNNKYYAVPSTTIDGQTFTCIEGVFDSAESSFFPAEGSGEFVLTAGPEDNSFYIYNTTLEKYLVATGSKKFGYVDNTSSDYGYWIFSAVSSGGFSGAFSVQHDNKTHYMRAYGSTVRCYDGASNGGVYLFKK